MIRRLLNFNSKPVIEGDIELTILKPSSHQNPVQEIASSTFKFHPLEESNEVHLTGLETVHISCSLIEQREEIKADTVVVLVRQISKSIFYRVLNRPPRDVIINSHSQSTEILQLKPTKTIKYQPGEFGRLFLRTEKAITNPHLEQVYSKMKISIDLESDEKSLFSEVSFFTITRPVCKLSITDPENLDYHLKQVDPEFNKTLSNGNEWFRDRDLYIVIEFLKSAFTCSEEARDAIDAFLSHTQIIE